MATALLSDLADCDPWTHAMRRGDFAGAWEVSDRVLAERVRTHTQCHTWPRHLQFIWNGEPVDGKHVLVRCYHGLGDTIQFVRFLAPLRKRARRVTLWAQPALMGLLANVDGIDALYPLHDGAPDVEYDIDIELMELPHVLRLRLEDLPGPIPYIGVQSIHTIRSSKLKQVGVAWRSGDWDERRSIPDALIESLATIPQVSWFSLQYAQRAPHFMIDLACKDIHHMATRMLDLDLIISVDTMVAHLAGALALPTWTLLPQQCDWRWMCEREDSPWYPTMRLFRQRTCQEWSDILMRIATELRQDEGSVSQYSTARKLGN